MSLNVQTNRIRNISIHRNEARGISGHYSDRAISE